MLLVVIGLVGSCGMLMLLVLQVRSDTFWDTELQFQPTQSLSVQLREPIREKPVPTPISLPCAVSGTALIAERLVSYDGAFLESGSGYEVRSVAALLLKNTGDMGISEASVVLEQGGRQLTFKATQIPPGASVLVLAESAKRYAQGAITGCYGWIDWESDGWWPEELLCFEEADMGSLWVTNITGSPLSEIRLYYKTDYADGLFYLGGVTYDIYIDSIGAGERVLLRPEHYAGNSSKFLRIQCGDQ